MSRDTALHAYWNFFSSFNSRDPHVFSMALHYPHVRVSWKREPGVIADPEAHALNLTWQPVIDSGWHHTNGAEPEIIHTSTNKWHIVGGWTRVREDDSPVLTNHVAYIVTRIDDLWGIQARFGMDSELEEANEVQDPAKHVVQTFQKGIGETSGENFLNLFASPTYVIDAGAVKRAVPISSLPLRDITSANVELVQRGLHSATFAFTGNLHSGLVYLTDTQGWKIRAMSWI